MKKLYVLPLVIVPFFILISFFSVRALAVTNDPAVNFALGKVYGNTYSGFSCDLEELGSFQGGATLAMQYTIEWPVTINLLLDNIPHSTQYFSGVISIPVYWDLQYDFITSSESNVLHTLDTTLTIPSFTGTDFSYYMYTGAHSYNIVLVFNNFDLNRNSDSYRRIGINGVIRGGLIVEGFNDIENVPFTVHVGAHDNISYSIQYNASLEQHIQNAINNASDINSIITLLNGLYNLELNSSLPSNVSLIATDVASLAYYISNLESTVVNAINSSSDIDSILFYLSQLHSDLYSSIFPKINNIDSLLASLVSSYNINSAALQSSVNSLVSYLNSIDSHLGTSSGYTVLSALTSLLSRIGTNSATNTSASVIGDLNRLLTNSNNIYSKLDTTHRLLTYIYAGLTGETGYIDIQSSSHDFWVGIIQDALQDFDFNINQDIEEGDTIINNDITQNDLRKIYNDHTIIQDFEIDISLDFADYMDQLDFNSVSFNSAPVSIRQATTSGLSLIERFYNELGDYTFLISITLFIGLVSALLGPINRFISKKI